MLNINFTADWPLDQAAKNFLANYCEQKRQESLLICRVQAAMNGSQFDETARPPVTGSTINMVLKASDWISNGVSVAGLTYRDGVNPMIDGTPEIWVSWVRETTPGDVQFGHIIRHELVHMHLNWQMWRAGYNDPNYDRDRLYSCHGAQAPNDDCVLLGLNKFINLVYMKGHSAWPGSLLER